MYKFSVSYSVKALGGNYYETRTFICKNMTPKESDIRAWRAAIAGRYTTASIKVGIDKVSIKKITPIA